MNLSNIGECSNCHAVKALNNFRGRTLCRQCYEANVPPWNRVTPELSYPDTEEDVALKTKRAWPLFVLAGSSFLPGWGFFFGAAAVTWGLISNRSWAILAAAIGAGGALLNLIGAILLIWYFELHLPTHPRTMQDTRHDLTKVVRTLEAYHHEKGRYPAELAALTKSSYSLPSIHIQDFSAGIFRWPRDYQYELAPDGQTYTLFAVGSDGQPGTADDLYPDLSDSVAQHSGYRAPR